MQGKALNSLPLQAKDSPFLQFPEAHFPLPSELLPAASLKPRLLLLTVFSGRLGSLSQAPLPAAEFQNQCIFLGICYNSTPPPGNNTCIHFIATNKSQQTQPLKTTHINDLIVSVGQKSGRVLAESTVQGPMGLLFSSGGSTGKNLPPSSHSELLQNYFLAVWLRTQAFAGSQILDATHSGTWASPIWSLTSLIPQ